MVRKFILAVVISFAVLSVESYAGEKNDALKQFKQAMSDRASNRILELSNLGDAPKKEINPLVANICHQAFIVENKQRLDKQASAGADNFDNIDNAEGMMFAEFIDYWAEQTTKLTKKKRKRALFKERALRGLAFEYDGKTADKKNFTITMRCMDIGTSRGWRPNIMKRGNR